jgi:hypothetical protein
LKLLGKPCGKIALSGEKWREHDEYMPMIQQRNMFANCNECLLVVKIPTAHLYNTREFVQENSNRLVIA